jgi:hypothetical protein
MPIIIGGGHRHGSSGYVCGSLSVVSATWFVAIVHLIIVGFIWLMGALFFLGVTDTKEHTRFDYEVGFAGA